jgi:hypothetical protein
VLVVVALMLGVLVALLVTSRRSPHHPRAVSRATPTAPTPTPGQPPPARAQFGVSVNWLFNGRNYTAPQIGAQLEALSRSGATIARSDALWELSEPQSPVNGEHHYDWRFDDLVAASLAAHGLTWLPIIDYSAPWARASPDLLHSPPSSPSPYASYAAALARRYGPGGEFWRTHPGVPAMPVDTIEIWNEPDNAAFWSPVPDAGRYAQLYLSARDAVTAVDPTVRVLIGGLTHPTTFLPAVLGGQPGLRGHLDGVAVHPYGPGPRAVTARVRDARRALASLGLAAVPLYVTEFGWTTRPPGALHYVPERLRAGYIMNTLATLAHADCGIAETVLYTWVTPERDPKNPEDWFGISPPQPRATPDTAAFTAGLAKALAPAAQIPLCAGG